MDDEQYDGFGEEDELDGQEPEKPKKLHILRSTLAMLTTIALAAAGLLAFIYRDYLSEEGLRSIFRGDPAAPAGEPFTYENGSSQTFALAGDGLAVASGSGIQLLNEGGVEVFSQVTSMENPAVSASRQLSLFYDLGGSTCVAAGFDGEGKTLDAGKSIISASVNASGYFTVISEESGSRGLVHVYGSDCRELYRWYAGTGWPIKAEVSPDNRRLAVLCVTGEGSAIVFFRLDSVDEQARLTCPGKLLFDLRFMGSDRVCAIGEDMALFAGADGAEVSRYDFAGQYLTAYDFGSGFAALLISPYRTGEGTLVTLDADGKVLGSAEPEGEIIALSAAERKLLAVTAGGMSLYSQALELQDSMETLITAKAALLRPRGDVLLLSSYFAQLYSF
ncbi:MAG: DUF5711 family protein [Butyricicoccus sp.]|nr:DUF5711 family protein [Butyricicoccus sp.]